MEIEKLGELTQAIKSDPQTPDKPKVEPIKGKTVKMKKSLLQRFKDDFFKVSLKDVKDRMFEEVVMPGIKDLVYDFIVTGVGVWFFDNIRGNKKATNNSTWTSYSYGSNTTSKPSKPVAEKRSSRVEGRIIPDKDEAQYVMTMMFEFLDQYQKVHVADYYQLINETPSQTDWNWGWTSLNGIDMHQVRYYDETDNKMKNGWVIDLPKVEPLN